MYRNASPRTPLLPRTEFPTTHWSLVLAAAQGRYGRTSDALEELCRAYWYPIYAYVRRRGYAPADAEDLTQEFFARLLAGDYLARADPHKGRFRAFLLTGVKYLLCDEQDRARRLKRGGRRRTISFDGAEGRYRLEPMETLTPELLFERAWVITLLDKAAHRLRDEYVASGQSDLYEHLARFRQDVPGQPAYAEVAERVGTTQAAIKSAIWRLRRRHHELLREEIAHTVADPSDVDGEIRHLLRVLAAPSP